MQGGVGCLGDVIKGHFPLVVPHCGRICSISWTIGLTTAFPVPVETE